MGVRAGDQEESKMHEATFVDNGYIYCLDCGDGFIVCVCIHMRIYVCIHIYIVRIDTI